MPVRAEAEHGRRPPERLGQVGERCDPDAAADEQRPLQVEGEAVPERTENVEPLAAPELAERRRSGPNRIDQEGKLPARRKTETHRPRQ